MNNVFLTLILFLLVAACGGGGGGSTTTSGASTSASAINWTTSGTTGATTATVNITTESVGVDSGKLCMPTTDTCFSGGAEFTVNAITDSITMDFEGSGPDFSSYEFAASDIESTTTITSDHTLGGTSYKYRNYSVVNSRYEEIDILIPSEYTHAYFVYWDNLNNGNVTTGYLNIAMAGSYYTGFTSLPGTGSATYTGGVDGFFAGSGGTTDSVYDMEGDSSFTANWATKQITGTFTNLEGINQNDETFTFPNVTMNAANIIADTDYVNEESDNLAYFVGNLEYSGFSTSSFHNRIYGYFLGPAYNEVGGVFELTSSSGGDGGGYFVAKR